LNPFADEIAPRGQKDHLRRGCLLEAPWGFDEFLVSQGLNLEHVFCRHVIGPGGVMVAVEEARVFAELDRGGRLTRRGERQPFDPAQRAVDSALGERQAKQVTRSQLRRLGFTELQRAGKERLRSNPPRSVRYFLSHTLTSHPQPIQRLGEDGLRDLEVPSAPVGDGVFLEPFIAVGEPNESLVESVRPALRIEPGASTRSAGSIVTGAAADSRTSANPSRPWES